MGKSRINKMMMRSYLLTFIVLSSLGTQAQWVVSENNLYNSYASIASIEAPGPGTKLAATSTVPSVSPGQDANAYSPDLPQLLPASPEPSLFVKAGVTNANTSTGAANANIPLYTIKLKDYAYPISLAYTTQGLKIDEASSRVGYGWTMNATGMITRSVRGEPDEFSAYHSPPNNDYGALTTYTDALYNYFVQGSTAGNGYDTQPDEFQFHVNGYSGKFVIDENNHPILTTTSNVSVSLDILRTAGSTAGSISNIRLTTPDGVVYKFGNEAEVTTSISASKYSKSPYSNAIKTAFFMDEIDLPTGEYILFSYSRITMQLAMGYTQTLTLSLSQGETACGFCPNYPLATNTDNIMYQTQYLSQISTSNGLNVSFGYGPRLDMSQDNRLISMNVFGNGNSIKQYAFEYYDVPGQTNVGTGRFFLTKVKDVTQGTGVGQSLDYTMTYNNLSDVPLPQSFHQDYLGYYNGSVVNYFISPSITLNNPVDFSFRNPNAGYSVIGTLSSIQYPTGGIESYTYEGNTTASLEQINTKASHTITGTGGKASGFPVSQTFSRDYTFPFDQKVTVTLTASTNNNPPDADDAKTANFFIYQGDTYIGSRSILGYTTDVTTFNLLGGVVYTFKLTVGGFAENGTLTIGYDTSPTPLYQTVNTPIPGVRLRQIQYTDPLTGSTHSKYYTYTTRTNQKYSTGSAPGVTYLSSNSWQSFCDGLSTTCTLYNYSSSSSEQVYNYSGSGSTIYYTTVLESDDPNFVNGGTEYIYFPNESGANSGVVLNNGISYLPAGQYPTLSGVLSKKNIFDKNMNVVESEEYQYETLMYDEVPFVYIRQNWNSAQATFNDTRMSAFDVSRGYFVNTWIRQKAKIVTQYSGSTSLSTETDYTYGTRDNVLPTQITTTDSQGMTENTVLYYPNTYTPNDAASSGYSALVSKNIVAPVIDQLYYKNNVLREQKQTFYSDWFNDGRIIQPQKVQLKESTSDVLHDAIYYNSYDAAGNPTELQKANDATVSYLWDQALSLPIAEIKGAHNNQVAFSSFENNAFGNWTAGSGFNLTSVALTGSNGYSGSLSISLSVAGSYQVSLWATGAAPTVNGASGVVIKTVTFNSYTWNLYQWTLTNPSTVTVSGSNLDDVRLYPTGSLMQTFTYKPFVGLIAQGDNNNLIHYYSYDSLSRLSAIADFDGNIVKTIEYQYKN